MCERGIAHIREGEAVSGFEVGLILKRRSWMGRFERSKTVVKKLVVRIIQR